jgi:hypothetical protein
MNIVYSLCWYEKDGDALVGEAPLEGVDEAQVRQQFHLTVEEPPCDCFQVTEEQKPWLSQLGVPILLDRFDYYIEAEPR